jgi:hypothetical protein
MHIITTATKMDQILGCQTTQLNQGTFSKKYSKAVPLCLADAKEERNYSSYSLTLALDGGEW